MSAAYDSHDSMPELESCSDHGSSNDGSSDDGGSSEDGGSSDNVSGALQWTGRMHHIFFAVVLPLVFEWCPLSDFFLADELFYHYHRMYIERNRCLTMSPPRFTLWIFKGCSVARAVCKDWFAAVYTRLAAHPLRADYDVRLLRSDTGGIMTDVSCLLNDFDQPVLNMWSTGYQSKYLAAGGTSVTKAYYSGVELNITQAHLELYEKWCRFLRCRALQDIFKSVLPGASLPTGLQVIQMRRVQIVGHPNGVAVMGKRTPALPSGIKAVFCWPPGVKTGKIFFNPRREAGAWSSDLELFFPPNAVRVSQ